MKVTLDTNCLIDLDEKREGWKAVQALVKKCRTDKIDLAVLGISASEKRKDGSHPTTFEDFKKRLDALELGHLTILNPVCFWGVTYFANCISPTEEMSLLHNTIMDILFRGSPFRENRPDADERYWAKHRNLICDGQAMWAHIWNRRSVFVTSDGNFHKINKKNSLLSIGAQGILRPTEFPV